MKKNGKTVQMLKSIMISYVLTALLLLALSWILWKMKISIATAGMGILVVYILSCLIGGFVYSGAQEEKKYLGGGLHGFVYFVIVYGISAWWNHSLVVSMPGMLTSLLICVFAGMLGGMIRSAMR